MKEYIRFGSLPEDLESKIHRGDGAYEQEAKGVSVWNCCEANGVKFPLLPENPNESTYADYFNHLLSNKPVYLVTGTEIGIGYDNEPVLGKDIQIIEEITHDYEYLKDILHHSKSNFIDNLVRLLYKISDYEDLKSYKKDLRRAINIIETIDKIDTK